MGSLYSRESENNDFSFENGPNPSSAYSATGTEKNLESFYGLDHLSREVKIYETDIKRTSRSVSNILQRFEGIPCRTAYDEVVACFRENPNQMSHCLSCMSTYRTCVHEATRNKLNQFVYEIKT